MMIASQCVALAQEWIEAVAGRMPGLIAAHLMGGINIARPDEHFAEFKDIDMNLIFNQEMEFDVHDDFYKGRIIEYGANPVKRYLDAETVLADSEIAPNLSTNSVIYDPTGFLSEVQARVSRDFKKLRWVSARCEQEKHAALENIEALDHAVSPIDAISSVSWLVAYLAGLLCTASLIPPTHRRHLVLMRSILAHQGRSDLYEAVLHLLGYANLTQQQVRFYQHSGAEAFDTAVRITRTPVPYQFKLHPYVKPYFVEGIQEIIDEGCHREAMFWVLAELFISVGAIQADGTESDKARFDQLVVDFCADLGWTSTEIMSARRQQARELMELIFQVGDEILSGNPEIER